MFVPSNIYVITSIPAAVVVSVGAAPPAHLTLVCVTVLLPVPSWTYTTVTQYGPDDAGGLLKDKLVTLPVSVILCIVAVDKLIVKAPDVLCDANTSNFVGMTKEPAPAPVVLGTSPTCVLSAKPLG